MIKGIPVTLTIRTKTGVDGFNAPIFAESTVVVDNVVVSPTEQTEIVNDLQLYGKKSVYTLHIPKGDTHNWENTKVVFFGKAWHTFGAVTEYIEANVPLNWNKKVKVELYG